MHPISEGCKRLVPEAFIIHLLHFCPEQVHFHCDFPIFGTWRLSSTIQLQTKHVCIFLNICRAENPADGKHVESVWFPVLLVDQRSCGILLCPRLSNLIIMGCSCINLHGTVRVFCGPRPMEKGLINRRCDVNTSNWWVGWWVLLIFIAPACSTQSYVVRVGVHERAECRSCGVFGFPNTPNIDKLWSCGFEQIIQTNVSDTRCLGYSRDFVKNVVLAMGCLTGGGFIVGRSISDPAVGCDLKLDCFKMESEPQPRRLSDSADSDPYLRDCCN